MFVPFFFGLRDEGILVSPTAFLRLQKALSLGMVCSLEDFYVAARTTMVKSERYFDLYDRIFAHHFHGIEFTSPKDEELEDAIKAMLEDWLKNPKELADALGIDPEEIKKLSPEELIQYFMDRLKEQTEEHHGGNKWIGTGGTSPVGHSGHHPEGMRVGGESRNKSAIKVAMERRYKDYSHDGPLDASQMAEALKRLRNMVPAGPKDQVNIEKSIYETVRNAGEIEIVFDRRLKDKLNVILMMDNGGWSMDPYIETCRTLFTYANSNFKEVKNYYFHNCIYDRVYADHQRLRKPFKTEDFSRIDPDTRLIIVGDASMAPYELEHNQGALNYGEFQSRSGLWWLSFLAQQFPHAVWLNPKPSRYWAITDGRHTLSRISQVFPMFDFTLEGLEEAVNYMVKKN